MDYGAKGDGSTKDTIAIRKALLDCGQNPVSVVYFPAGKFLTAPFNLTSGITLFVRAALPRVSPSRSLSPGPADLSRCYCARQSGS